MRRASSILVVEDVDVMRDLLAHVLGGIPGFTVSGLARNGWEARLELTRRRPDLVLLDEVLPGESSSDLLQEFVSQGIPVLLLTGLENPSHPPALGASGRLFKPSWKTVDADRARIAPILQATIQGPIQG